MVENGLPAGKLEIPEYKRTIFLEVFVVEKQNNNLFTYLIKIIIIMHVPK